MVPGGAEHVTLELSQLLPDADVIVAAASPQCASLAAPIAPRLKALHRRIPANPVVRTIWALRTFEKLASSIRRYDWVIFSGSFAPAAAVKRRDQPNFLYCHTIPRFAYDLFPYYRNQLGRISRPAFDSLTKYVRRHYEEALNCMTRIAANSINTRQRIQRFLALDAEVIYPPCAIADFCWKAASDFYLSTARLEPYKRVDVIIDAFREMPEKKLVVASGGTLYEQLRRRAQGAANIEFSGWLSRAEMADLLANCIASIYIPVDEDFGLSPVESMAAGKPVIAVAEGGIKETIVDEITGILLGPDPTPTALVDAVQRMTPARALSMREACVFQARRFDKERFREQILEFIGMPPGRGSLA